MSAKVKTLTLDGNLQESVDKHKDMLAFVDGRKIKSSYLRQTLAETKQVVKTAKLQLENQRRETERIRGEAERERREAAVLLKLSRLELKAKAFVKAEKIGPAVDAYQKIVDLISRQRSESNNPEFVTILKRISGPKKQLEEKLW